MADDLKKGIIIEFYGFPGCGKSTISHFLVENLKKSGADVMEPSYQIDHKYSPGLRKILKVFYSIRYLCFHPVSSIQLLCMIRKKANGDVKILFSHSVNILYKFFFYCKQKKWDYLIFDEGLIQSWLSMSSRIREDVGRNNPVFVQLREKEPQMVPVYIETSIPCALERMEKRNIHDSRIEKMLSLNERKAAMTEWEEILGENSFPNTFRVNGELDMSEILSQIQNELSGRGLLE